MSLPVCFSLFPPLSCTLIFLASSAVTRQAAGMMVMVVALSAIVAMMPMRMGVVMGCGLDQHVSDVSRSGVFSMDIFLLPFHFLSQSLCPPDSTLVSWFLSLQNFINDCLAHLGCSFTCAWMSLVCKYIAF